MAGPHQMQGNDHVRWDSYSSSSCCCICYHSEGADGQHREPEATTIYLLPNTNIIKGFLPASKHGKVHISLGHGLRRRGSEGSDATHFSVTPHAFFSRNHHVCQGKDICFLRCVCVWLEEDGSWGCFWHLNISLYLIFIRYELINELDAIPQSWHHHKSKCISHVFFGQRGLF